MWELNAESAEKDGFEDGRRAACWWGESRWSKTEMQAYPSYNAEEEEKAEDEQFELIEDEEMKAVEASFEKVMTEEEEQWYMECMKEEQQNEKVWKECEAIVMSLMSASVGECRMNDMHMQSSKMWSFDEACQGDLMNNDEVSIEEEEVEGEEEEFLEVEFLLEEVKDEADMMNSKMAAFDEAAASECGSWEECEDVASEASEASEDEEFVMLGSDDEEHF